METQPRRDRITDNVQALPLVEAETNKNLINEKTAQATLYDLSRLDSTIPERTRAQVEQVSDEVRTELEAVDDTHYIISEQELQGIVARAAIRGATQTVNDIGTVLQEIDIIRQIVGDDDAT